MPSLPPSLQQLVELGYEVGIAHGSVEVEEQALAAAIEASSDSAIADHTLAVLGGVPADQELSVTQQVVERIVQQTTKAANDRVEFHRRALAIAKEMPTVYVVSGHGITALYLPVDDATGEHVDGAEIIASLVASHPERAESTDA